MNLSKSTRVHDAVPKQSSMYLPKKSGMGPVYRSFGGNDSRKRHEKRLIFKIGTIHPHGLNERFSFI